MALSIEQQTSAYIRQALAEKRMNYETAADVISVSRRTFIRRLADGRFSLPDLQRLAIATDRPLRDLLPQEVA